MRILFTCCLAESRALSVHKYMYVGYMRCMSISRKTCAVHEMSHKHTQRSLFGGSTHRVMKSGTFLLLGQDLDPAGLPG